MTVMKKCVYCKKELKEDFLILTLVAIMVMTSLTNVVVFVINEDTKFIKEKIIKIENEIIDVTSPITASINFIRENIRESINLKQLSGKACMSTTSFYRSFKRELGMSPIEFILNEKIKFAKKLLSNPKINIAEVSYATGFEDCNYFIRLFKKYEGITPKQYQLMNFNG